MRQKREVSAKIWLTELVRCTSCSARGTEFSSSSHVRRLTTRALGDPKRLVSEGTSTHVHTHARARTYTFFLKWDLSTKQGSSGYDQICLPHKPSIHSTSSSSGSLQKCLKSQAPVSEHVFQTRDTTKDSSYGTPILTTLDLEGWPYVLFHSALERRRLCSQRPDSSSIKKKNARYRSRST